MLTRGPDTVTAPAKVTITMRAVLQRINRRLASDKKQLRSSWGVAAADELGDYYLLDLKKSTIDTKKVDPVALAKRLGVMKPWEVLEDAEK